MAFELNANKLIINPFYSRILSVWLKLMLKVVDRTCYICRFEKNIKQCCLPRCSVQRHLFMSCSTKSLEMTVYVIRGSKPSDRVDYITGFATVCQFPNQCWKKKCVSKFAQCCCIDIVVLRLVRWCYGFDVWLWLTIKLKEVVFSPISRWMHYEGQWFYSDNVKTSKPRTNRIMFTLFR